MMCLTTIDKEPIKCEYGYKVFDIRDGKICSPICNRFEKGKKKPLPTGKWLNEKNWRKDKRANFIVREFGKKYPMGWHIFIYKKDAKEWLEYGDVIKKVKIKGIVTSGTQYSGGYLKIVVAKEMLIMPK